MRRGLVLLALASALGCPAAAAAPSPWALRCASMPAEQPVPAALRGDVRRFVPWVPSARALRAGPVYVVALSSHTAISRDGDALDASSYYLHRALIAIAPSYRGALVVRGARLGAAGARTTLELSTDGASACTVDPPDVSCDTLPHRFARSLRIGTGRGWRVVRTELRIGRTGCFALVARGRGLHAVVPLAVPGPDYGTPGW